MHYAEVKRFHLILLYPPLLVCPHFLDTLLFWELMLLAHCDT